MTARPDSTVLLLLLTSLPSLTLAGAETVHAHGPVLTGVRWERELASQRQYDNPYADVDLHVTYTAPDGERYESRGFWDGGDTFRIRFLFARPGVWSWQTRCSDTANTGLHGQSGQVHVSAYDGANPFFKHGTLRPGADGRYLAHADGTPFLWIGDTTWLGYIRATQEEWKAYIDDRASRGFSVVMTSCSCVARDTTDPDGEAPFTDAGMRQWNPAFWRSFDEKVRYANDKGILVVVAGVVFGNRARRAPARDVLAFSRNLAARLAGSHVVLSPRQDWNPGREESLNESGLAIKQAAPLALVTQHPRRIIGVGVDLPMPDQVLRRYYHLSSTDFVGVQTGKGDAPDDRSLESDRAARATIEWIQALYREAPHKPVINLEGLYDEDPFFGSRAEQTAMARKQGYLSFLSGAYGYTSSTYSIWAWGRPTSWPVPPADLHAGMNHPYAAHLGILNSFLRRFDWWRLRPDHERIRNQPDDWSRRMVFALSHDKNLGAAYLPDNRDVVLDMSAFDGEVSFYWANPIDGTVSLGESAVRNEGEHRFEKPAGWSDALIVLKTRAVRASRMHERGGKRL